MSEYIKEAERLLSEYGDAVSDAVVFAQDPAGYSMRMEEATRAAMLAHIQRGAVPEGWQLVPKEPTPEMLAGGWGYWLNVMAPGKQRDTAAKEYTAMLAAAPSPDQFRGATVEKAWGRFEAELQRGQVKGAASAEVALQRGLARDNDALDEARAERVGVGCGTSGACYAAANGQPELCQREQITSPAPADVPMPQGYAECPSDYTGDIWIESQMRTYGAACSAAGYARGRAEAVRDAERYRWLRRHFAIVGTDNGAVFHALNLPTPTHIAPDAAIELDASIDAAVSGR